MEFIFGVITEHFINLNATFFQVQFSSTVSVYRNRKPDHFYKRKQKSILTFAMGLQSVYLPNFGCNTGKIYKLRYQ